MRNKSRLLIAALVGAALAVSTVAQAQQNKEAGNGGAGVRRNGQLMSFYSAGLYVEPTNDPNEIPELENLIRLIADMTFLSPHTRGQWIAALTATEKRQYLKVKHFDETTKSRLLAEFKRATGVEIPDMDLFAVTDSNSKTTFLLPAFYEIPADRVNDIRSSLIHENVWILRPKATYKEVVDIEMAFQAVLEQPANINRQMHLISKIGSKADRIRFAVQFDLATGALGKLVNKEGTIEIETLFGPEFTACGGFKACFTSALEHLSRLSSQHPNSLVLKSLMRSIANNDVTFNGKHDFRKTRSYCGDCKPERDWRWVDRLTGIFQCTIDTRSVLRGSSERLVMNCSAVSEPGMISDGVSDTWLTF